jgi:hypothetical protein
MRAGIHGSTSDGAYSVVLSGGYDEDEDKGDTFVYTGSGGIGSKEPDSVNLRLIVNCMLNLF